MLLYNPRYAAEPNVKNPGQSLWQMLPQIEISFDPWDDTNVTAFFLPDRNEHPTDAKAQHIDILMQV